MKDFYDQIDRLISTYSWNKLQTLMDNIGILRDREMITAAEYRRLNKYVRDVLS